MPPEDYPCLRFQAPFQSARRSLRHLVTYGSTNKYIPVKNIKASAATAKRPIQLVYLCLNTATPLKMTTNGKGDRQPAVQLPNPFAPVQMEPPLKGKFLTLTAHSP